jgi:hypothetical protein
VPTGSLAALAVALWLGLSAGVAIAAEEPPAGPAATPRPVPLDKAARPVRVRVPYAGIDLPVISSDRNVAGNPRGYPLCDVAQFWTKYDLPGEPGTTWIYAHAQPGMFLSLYEINDETGGEGLIGKLVKLQLRDRRLLTYRITEVRISPNERIAERPNQRQHRLILQTSTGPPGTVPKLQVAALLIDAGWTEVPRPDPQPRACWQPRPRPTRKPANGGVPTPTPEPVEVIDESERVDVMTLLLGSGAVLLGATVVAVYVARKP